MKTLLFKDHYQIKLADTDAAGVLYFARLYDIVHACYENFMLESSLSLKKLLDEKNYHLPIIHSEADYKQVILLGDMIQIQLFLDNISQHTFTLNYELSNVKKQIIAHAKTVHISIKKSSTKKINLPEEVIQIFTQNISK
ncbi:MAG: thioesterase family protein [Pseudomonadota bacterium]